MQPVKTIQLGSFLTTFYFLCVYVTWDIVIVKIFEIIKERFLGFTHGN